MTSTTFFIIFIPILAILLLAINLILAPHNPYQEKDSAFECGFHSFLGQNRTQFSVSFFIFGLLFLLFDLEILLVYPYAVSTNTNDIYGLSIMLIFFVLLTLGFVFELGKGALTIESRQTSSYSTEDNTIPHAFLSLHLSIRKTSCVLQSNSYSIFQANNRVLKVSGMGPSSYFTWPIYTVVICIMYPDLSVHTFLQDGMDFWLKGFAELKQQHPSIQSVYEQYISIKKTNFSVVNFLYDTSNILPRFTELPNTDHLLPLHLNILKYKYVSEFFYCILTCITLVIGVNIHNLVNFFSTIINKVFNFVSGIKKKSSGYGGANKDTSTQTLRSESNNTPKNNKSGVVTAEKKSNGGSDEGDGKDPGKNKITKILSDKYFSITMRELTIILRTLRDRVLLLRNQPGYNMQGVFGANHARELVTFNQVMNYIIHNPHETLALPNRNIQIGQLLTLDIINIINRQGHNYDDESRYALRNVTWSDHFAFTTRFTNIMHGYSINPNTRLSHSYGVWRSGATFNILHAIEYLESLDADILFQQV